MLRQVGESGANFVRSHRVDKPTASGLDNVFRFTEVGGFVPGFRSREVR